MKKVVCQMPHQPYRFRRPCLVPFQLLIDTFLCHQQLATQSSFFAHILDPPKRKVSLLLSKGIPHSTKNKKAHDSDHMHHLAIVSYYCSSYVYHSEPKAHTIASNACRPADTGYHAVLNACVLITWKLKFPIWRVDHTSRVAWRCRVRPTPRHRLCSTMSGKRSRPESGYYRYLHSVSSTDHEAAVSNEGLSPPKKQHLNLTKHGKLSSEIFLVDRLISERPSKTHKVVCLW